jgi:hypothetical protein
MNTELLAQLWAKLTQLKPHVLKITAAILLLISIVLALLDRIAAGSLVAALFVVVALFDFLPQLESFAAFGIKAQWRKQLDDELPAEDAAILTRFADHIADIDEECRRTGRVTEEATKLIDAYRIEDRPVLYRGLFGR